MSRIARAFEKKAYIGYLTAGDASKDDFLTMVQGGVGLLEIGIPFSDPVADGPVIQKAMARALEKGATAEDVLKIVTEIRNESDVAIVLFTYLNPIQSDMRGFMMRAKAAGADGMLIVDLPLEEGSEYRRLCREIGLDPIFVIAPSTPEERMKKIVSAASGFVYYACRKGTTGARHGLPEDYEEKVGAIRRYTSLPIAVGFGIADKETAQAILKAADGVVIGSYFVDGLEKGNLKTRVEQCCSN